MLQNRVYRGEIVHKEQSYPGEHMPIIDQPPHPDGLRNFAAYAAALAGYTAAIIAGDLLGATGGVNGEAFLLAVIRASEIRRGRDRLHVGGPAPHGRPRPMICCRARSDQAKVRSTRRWRGMDSNFQYAGAVSLIVRLLPTCQAEETRSLVGPRRATGGIITCLYRGAPRARLSAVETVFRRPVAS
jgi:hypothetical protein